MGVGMGFPFTPSIVVGAGGFVGTVIVTDDGKYIITDDGKWIVIDP
jgi:hypothetical protein